jgi:hemerythrin-like domain-containing protein
MEATELLKKEHRIIERVLASLEVAAGRLSAGEPVAPGIFIMAADFIKGFADGCHHKKEEDVLFPAMQGAGIPREGGPIGVMLAEHEQGRRLTGGMRAAAEKLAAGETRAREAVVQNALQYVALLRGHIAKEENILFAMADRVIAGPAQAEVSAAFDRVEQEETGEGVHERFLGLAESIEKEIAR